MAVGDGQHVHAGRLSGGDAVAGVVDGQAALRWNIETPGCLPVEVGCRFAVHDVLARDHGGERVGEA
jgi:hypothetical protein